MRSISSRSTASGLDLVAQSLLERETIDGADVSRLVQQGLEEHSLEENGERSRSPRRPAAEPTPVPSD